MEEPQIERRKMVTVPQEEFEAILERAAERGARHALSEVGLDGPEAARDISELRSLLDAFNEAKKTAGADHRPDAGHRAGVGAARRGVREAEGVRGWAVREQTGNRAAIINTFTYLGMPQSARVGEIAPTA
jgi:hypothetical protein